MLLHASNRTTTAQSSMEMDVDTQDIPVEPPAPRPIIKLSEDVVNQIAAAEIIHRPSNAIKELVENSLDAGSTSIRVTLKDGGLKLLQIQDNGSGIQRADLPLLCTRFATSKLREFSDLQSLQTYGFRGEALASISYVSHMSVTTKVRGEACGYKAYYSEGVLAPPKPGADVEPKPSAATEGTLIIAEDLFYNMPLRKRAFKSPPEEYGRVLDVLTRYAVHNPHVAWVCKKVGSNLPDISTPLKSDVKTNIGLLYGSALAKELLQVPRQRFEELCFSAQGWVSNANWNTKRGSFLLFINHRLVESTKIKRAIDSLYGLYLPKGTSPFVYLSLEIDPERVDVNVHPTKSEVHFLNEDEVIESLVSAVQSALAGANASRSFTVQTLLPGARDPFADNAEASISQRPPSSKPAPNYKIRMDPQNRTLQSMFPVSDPSQVTDAEERPSKRRATDDVVDSTLDSPKGKDKASAEIAESVCAFTSVRELRLTASKGGSSELAEIISNHTLVGLVDQYLCQSLIQHRTALYLVNHCSLADEHFYQLGLRQFGAYHRLKLDPPPPLATLLALAIENEPDVVAQGLDQKKVLKKMQKTLMDNREMLDEYFSLLISEQGDVTSLPMLLKGYTPNLDRLPYFLLCIGARVDWTEERACFGTFLQELAYFYSPRPLARSDDLPSTDEQAHERWQLEHVLFPSLRKYTTWPRRLSSDVKQIANLPDLFKIFERC